MAKGVNKHRHIVDNLHTKVEHMTLYKHAILALWQTLDAATTQHLQ